MTKILGILFVLSTLINCSAITKKEHEGEQTRFLKNTFKATSINGENIIEMGIYLNFNEDKNTISGNSGCNTYTSSYTIENEKINFQFPISSKMYCENKMTAESNFFKALMKVNSFKYEENELIFFNQNSEPIMILKTENATDK